MRRVTGLSPTRLAWLAAATIVAVGMALRLWAIPSTPLWLDEAYSAYAADKGLRFLWTVVPRYETHPPFYYTLVWFWSRIVGDGLVALRALGLLAALAAFPVMAVAAHELARIARLPVRPLVLAAIAILAVAVLPVEMAREVRPYPVMILVYAGGVAALLALRRRVRAGAGFGGKAAAAYLAALLAMLWLHNLGPLYAAALGTGCLLAVWRRGMRRAEYAKLFGGHAAVLLAWAPALLILIDQAPSWVSSTWLTFDPGMAGARVAMLYAGPRSVAQGTAGLLAAIGLGRLARLDRRAGSLLVVTAFLPVLLSLVISMMVAPVFLMRTLTPVAIPAILLMAAGAIPRHGSKGRVAGLIVLAILCLSMLGRDVLNRRAGPPQDWYGTVRWLAARWRPGDVVLAYPNEGALPFDRAVRDLGLAIPSRPIPTPIPSLAPPPGSWYVSGSRGVPSLDRPHLEAIADAPAMRTVPTVWLLRLGPWAYDKDDVLLRALLARREAVGRFRAGPIDLIGLRRLD